MVKNEVKKKDWRKRRKNEIDNTEKEDWKRVKWRLMKKNGGEWRKRGRKCKEKKKENVEEDGKKKEKQFGWKRKEIKEEK